LSLLSSSLLEKKFEKKMMTQVANAHPVIGSPLNFQKKDENCEEMKD
jgi:hypothetical protein